MLDYLWNGLYKSRGITKDGKVLVADPASYKRSGQQWDMSIILNEARGDAAAGGPFWSVE